MVILTVYRGVLADTAAVNNLATGGYHFLKVDQNTRRPNVLLEMPEEGQDYSHQGPVGLLDAHVRITARADTPKAASDLGDAIVAALRNWTGTRFGCAVQLTEHFNTTSGYDDAAKVFTCTAEFTAFYSRS